MGTREGGALQVCSFFFFSFFLFSGILLDLDQNGKQ